MGPSLLEPCQKAQHGKPCDEKRQIQGRGVSVIRTLAHPELTRVGTDQYEVLEGGLSMSRPMAASSELQLSQRAIAVNPA